MGKIENETEYEQGRKGKQYLLTFYEILDALFELGGSDLYGFYGGLKRYIDRKETDTGNEVIYNQKWVRGKMKLSDRKYYSRLKLLYNCGMIDIKKTFEVTFYIKLGDKNSKLQTKKIVYFSTLDGTNISVKSPKQIIEDELGFPKENIVITKTRNKTSYTIHNTPGDEFFKSTNCKLVEFRNYEEDMSKFRRGLNKKENVDNVDECGQFVDNSVDNQENNNKTKEKPSLHNEKVVSFHNEKINNNIIFKDSNNIILDSNKSNHSFIEQNEKELNELNKIKSNCQLKCFGEDEFFMEALIEDLYYSKEITCSKSELKPPVIRKRLSKLDYDVLRTSQMKYEQRQKDILDKGLDPIGDVMSYYKTITMNTLSSHQGNKTVFK